LIVGQTRIATSLSSPPDWPLDLNKTSEALCIGEYCCRRIQSEAGEYFIGFAPVLDRRGNVVAISEIDSLTESIREGALHTMAVVLALGFGLAVGGSVLAILLTRRISQPLTGLADAAERMGAGDLDSSITSDSFLLEINQLTSQLDIARRRLRNVQQATQRDMKQIEHLLGSIREGLVSINDAGQVIYFSADAERILGYKAHSALQSNYMQIFRPAPGEIVTAQDVLQNIEENPHQARYLSILNAQDQPITIAVTASWNENGSLSQKQREYVLVLRDVSEEEALNKLRCNFLANVAHEFRTPLAGVLATIELLSTEGASLSPEELDELVSTIRISSLNLQTLVDNILESATIEAGCFQIRRRMTDFQIVIKNSIDTMNPILRRRKQRLELSIPDTPLVLWADPDRLTQVLVNLLANASRYGPMNKAIALSVRIENNALMAAVLDSGPGLPAGHFNDLFKRFFTGDQPRGAKYGIGLGLSVTKTIIEAHGGQIGAENQAEGGARVWFTLPVNKQVID
jgi:two-component system sensor histidine kinase ResE